MKLKSQVTEDSSEQEQTTKLDNEAMSRTDRFLITSMLSASRDHLVPLTRDTMIGGVPLGQIMESGCLQLYLDLKSNDPLESVLVSLLVRTQKAATDCFNEAERNTQNLNAHEISLRYALKATDMPIRLSQELERHRAKQAERVRVHTATAHQMTPAVAPGPHREKINGRSLSKRKSKAPMKLNGNGQHA